MVRTLIFSALATLSLISCQKEISLETGAVNTGGTGGGTGGTGGGGTATGLINKVIINSPFDTTTIKFGYDNSQKLKTNTVFIQGMLSAGDFRRHISRDAQGRIALVKDSSEMNGGVGWDTATTHIFYVGTTSTVAYALSYYSTTEIDSIVYTYSNNRITKASIYEKNNAGGRDLFEERIYTYDAAGNITNSKIYTATSGTLEFETENIYTYDNKTSPFNYGAEAVVISAFGVIDMGEHVVGPNNPTKREEIDQQSGISDIGTSNYTYNTANKPTLANVSYRPGGSPIGIPGTTSYHY